MCQTTKEQRAKRRAAAKEIDQAVAAIWEARHDPEALTKASAAAEKILAAPKGHATMSQTAKEERAKRIAAAELFDQVVAALGEARHDPQAFIKAYATAKLKTAPLTPDEAEAHFQASQKAKLDAWKKQQAANNTLGPKVRTWIRRAFTDDETCTACRKRDGDAYYTLEDIDWWPGNDCEGGPDCRCELITIYADEGKYLPAK